MYWAILRPQRGHRLNLNRPLGISHYGRDTVQVTERRPVTTFENRPNTALLVVDVQTGVVSGNYERDAVVANIAADC